MESTRMYHEHVEALLAQIRMATAAKTALDRDDLPKVGAVVDFPVFVTAPAMDNRHRHPWSMTVSHEPGTPFALGVTPITYHVQIGRCVLAGTFPICVGNPTATSRSVAIAMARSGEHAVVIPQPIYVAAVGYSKLRADLQALVAQRARALDDLIAFTRPFLVQLARRVRSGMREAGALDLDDLVQEAWPAVLRLIDQFGSPRRPPTTWATAVKRNVLRDLGRVKPKFVGVSYQVWQIRRWLDRHPNIVEPREVAHRMTVEHQSRRQYTTATESPMADHVHEGPEARLVVSERLIRQAQLIPSMVPLNAALKLNVA
jgi:DNA-directed RNA polymerase specialized sigma24 family protein